MGDATLLLPVAHRRLNRPHPQQQERAVEEIATRISKALETKSFSGSLKFDCGEDGVIVMADGSATTTDRATDCTLKLSQENLINLLKGKLNPIMALASGKLKLSGNPAIAMGLAKLLG
jgi:putative sterol carrier protein